MNKQEYEQKQFNGDYGIEMRNALDRAIELGLAKTRKDAMKVVAELATGGLNAPIIKATIQRLIGEGQDLAARIEYGIRNRLIHELGYEPVDEPYPDGSSIDEWHTDEIVDEVGILRNSFKKVELENEALQAELDKTKRTRRYLAKVCAESSRLAHTKIGRLERANGSVEIENFDVDGWLEEADRNYLHEEELEAIETERKNRKKRKAA